MKKLLITSFFLFAMTASNFAQTITTIAGNGTLGYNGDGGLATVAKLGQVTGVAVDNAGNTYIGDHSYNVVRKINTAGIISTFAGNGTHGFSGDNGPATAAQLDQPECFAFDSKGNIYFFDNTYGRIRKIDATGIITTFAGGGSPYATDGVPATSVRLSGGGGGFGICNDDLDNIYISAGFRIFKVSAITGILTNYAGNGLGGGGGNGGPATAASIACTGQIAMDGSRNLYFVQDTTVRKITAAGVVSKVAGTSVRGFSGDGGPATAASLNGATGVYPDNCGNFYIADCYNNRIRKVDGHGIITTVAGNGYGAPTGGGYAGDGGAATASELYNPVALYLDKNSNIYIADNGNNCIRYIKMDSCKSVLETVQPVEIREGISVFPNPNTGTFTVMVQSASREAVHFTICNMVGMKVGEYDAVTNEAWQPEHSMSPGVYLLHAATERGRYVEKIVVR